MIFLNKLTASLAIYALLAIPAAYAAGNTTVVNDSDLNRMVELRIMDNIVTRDSNIKVETREGVVYLLGNVETHGEADAAIEAANSIYGVKDVDTENLMVQNSAQPYTDSFITAKVKGAFIREKLFGDSPIASLSISVETKDGVVYLTGTADNPDQVNTAMSLAREINGVKQVESNVSIISQ